MPKHLYIIGNGFDLHHKINSSYVDFMNWMNANHSDVMCRVDDIYGFCDKEWWSDFENQLASLDAISYGEGIAFENRPDLTSDHCDRMWNDAEIEVEQQLDELYSDLRGYFHEWIMQLDSPIESKKVELITQYSVFINFNYTKTLENLYGINQHNILHIHGCIDENEDFILGHGESYESLVRMNTVDLAEPPDDLPTEELAEYYDEHAGDGQMIDEQLATDAAIRGVASQRKPVEDIIKRNEDFFNSLSDFTHIHVYGLSLSKVDIPYLEHILSKNKSMKWEFNDYKGDNYDKIKSFCEDNNIYNYNIIELENIIDTKQLKIPFPDL